MLKVLTNVQLTMAEWLLFISETSRVEDSLQQIFIPLDCEFLVGRWQDNGTVQLTEVYHISGRSGLKENNVGNWSVQTGLQWRTIGFYRRRRNLHGLQLRVVVSEVRSSYWSALKKWETDEMCVDAL
jgi:hypothetical protein